MKDIIDTKGKDFPIALFWKFRFQLSVKKINLKGRIYDKIQLGAHFESKGIKSNK